MQRPGGTVFFVAVVATTTACAGGGGGRGAEDSDAATGTPTAGTGDASSADTSSGGTASSSEVGTTAGPTSMGSSSTTEGDGETTGGPAALCDRVPTSSALAFDGLDDHVSMGVAPELGLATFTLEAWVRRDGAGQEGGTGAGGLSLSPIIAKGRGENDDTVYNCNYAFGFRGNVLGADFEDATDGGNHPVVGTTAVTFGRWHHVAATYDGNEWSLFVDGQLDAQLVVNATPRADSIQHFALGTMMDSAGAPAGRLAGVLDEVRVWDHARSEAEIRGSMYATLAAGEGLVSRWALDQEDADARDSVGSSPGTIDGATFEGAGAVLDSGEPPSIIAMTPSDDAVLGADSAAVGISVIDADDDEFVATYYVRELSAQDDFTIVVLPDTQYYSDVDSPSAGSPQYFHDQTQWVRDNREAYNIQAVIHNGDIVNHGNAPEEWVIADAAMSRLETPEAALPEGVPYGVCVGNHDQDAIGQDGAVEGFNTWFGVDRFAGRSYYGGHYGPGNEENWNLFTAGGLEFVVVNLQYDTTPDPAVNTWARTVFEAHPDAFGVLNTHYVLGASGTFGLQAQAIYDELRATQNVHLMTGGHVSAESRRSDVFQGHTIYSMLADYQADGDGGTGFLRIWEFSPANGELTVRSYSPSIDTWLTDDDSEFTLPVDLPGAGAAFEAAAIVDPAAATHSAPLEGLVAGRTYEWYASVTDCAHTVRSPVGRFTVR